MNYVVNSDTLSSTILALLEHRAESAVSSKSTNGISDVDCRNQLNEEVGPSPLDLANRWIVEYVWEVWITESGPVLRAHTADGYDSLRAEQEMRAVLEAKITAHGLPGDRPLTASDFATAIEEALTSLGRVAGESS